uniref:Phosphoesterase n=2 Tax=Staphylothermus marinus TaxID=2280 RepID=A0A7C4HEF9_STAMA
MLLGIISDSHDNVSFVVKAINVLINNNIDEIIHLGDIISPFIPRFIKREFETKNVDIKLTSILGNNDGDVYSLNKVFNEYKWRLLSNPCIVEYENRSFYLMHGYSSTDFTEKLARAVLEKLDVDGVFYGHTHRLLIDRIGDRILLNPGEVCGYLTGRSTVVILDTRDLSTRVIELT